MRTLPADPTATCTESPNELLTVTVAVVEAVPFEANVIGFGADIVMIPIASSGMAVPGEDVTV